MQSNFQEASSVSAGSWPLLSANMSIRQAKPRMDFFGKWYFDFYDLSYILSIHSTFKIYLISKIQAHDLHHIHDTRKCHI